MANLLEKIGLTPRMSLRYSIIVSLCFFGVFFICYQRWGSGNSKILWTILSVLTVYAQVFAVFKMSGASRSERGMLWRESGEPKKDAGDGDR